MADRTTKALLVLVALGLWACAARPWLGPVPARAQAAGGGFQPPPVIYTYPSPPLLGVAGDGTAYVVSGGYLSAYRVEGSSRRLSQVGQERIPVAPAQPPPQPSVE